MDDIFLQWLESAKQRADRIATTEILKNDPKDPDWKYQMVGYYNAHIDIMSEYKAYLEFMSERESN